MGDLIAHTRKQIKEGGELTFGVGYYVDQTSERPLHLDSEADLISRSHSREALRQREGLMDKVIGVVVKAISDEAKDPDEKEAAQAKRGLNQAIGHIKTKGGGTEYHWEEGMKVLNQEPWSPRSDIEKVIFLITDEEGDIGEKGYTRKDVIQASQTQGVRFEVIMSLTGSKNMTIEEAQDALSYKGWKPFTDKDDRQTAIEVLRDTNSKRFIPELIRALNPEMEKDTDVRLEAAKALREIGGPKALEALTRALNPEMEKDEYVRGKAAQALGKIGGPKALEALTRALNPEMENAAYVREAAVGAIRKIKNRSKK